MKYEYYPKRRTEQERRELNEQILRLLQSEACEQAGVTDEDIFNRYTGDGGLHGLRRSDYENYNAFSAAKKELENGQFFTPPPLCEMIVSALRLSDTDLVADLTCGMGNFFNFLPNERNAYGCEVNPNACAVARKLYPQAHIVQGDIRDYVRLRNGVPDMAACDSLENGVILLYNRICAKANAELDILLEESEIDRILRGEDQDAAPEVIALAEREAQEFINDLLSGLRERMLELKSGKVIFLGGGATLLRRQIEASGKIGQAIFVEDINANAKGYEYLYRLQHSGR